MPLLFVRGLKIASEMLVYVRLESRKTCTYRKNNQKRDGERLGNREVSDAWNDLIPAQECENYSWLQFG